MAKLFPAKLVSLLALVTATLIAAACSGGSEEASPPGPAVDVPQGLSVTLYASPT